MPITASRRLADFQTAEKDACANDADDDAEASAFCKQARTATEKVEDDKRTISAAITSLETVEKQASEHLV